MIEAQENLEKSPKKVKSRTAICGSSDGLLICEILPPGVAEQDVQRHSPCLSQLPLVKGLSSGHTGQHLKSGKMLNNGVLE